MELLNICGSEWSYIEFGSVCSISLCGTPFTLIDSEECAKDFLEYLKSFK